MIGRFARWLDSVTHRYVVWPMDRWTVRMALSRVYRPQGVEIWMRSRHPAFGGLTAEQMIQGGMTDDVLAEIDRLSTGAFG